MLAWKRTKGARRFYANLCGSQSLHLPGEGADGDNPLGYWVIGYTSVLGRVPTVNPACDRAPTESGTRAIRALESIVEIQIARENRSTVFWSALVIALTVFVLVSLYFKNVMSFRECLFIIYKSYQQINRNMENITIIINVLH